MYVKSTKENTVIEKNQTAEIIARHVLDKNIDNAVVTSVLGGASTEFRHLIVGRPRPHFLAN